MQLGIHHVDTLASWLGPGRGARRGASRTSQTDADIDDVGVVTLEFASGALGVVTGSYVSPKTLSLRLLGTRGGARLPHRLLGLAGRRARSTA